jgi:3-oxoacyl-[acyl-carrier-protein] synthase-1
MEKVFITGRGLLTPLGIGLPANEAALRAGKSGIVRAEEFEKYHLDSTVGGVVAEIPESPLVDRKVKRFCPPCGQMSVTAVSEALAEANIAKEEIPGLRIAVIGGVAGSLYSEAHEETANFLRSGRIRGVSPYIVPRVMPSSAVSNLSLIFGFTGESYDISAACASSAVAIMVGARLIKSGLYDIVVAGGAEQLDWVEALGFCAIRALSRAFNDDPGRASRPFDRDRDGFVLAAGASYVVLESGRSVRRRQVRPISEISGCYSNSNATDMVVPDAAASEAVIRGAIIDAGLRPQDIGYLNTHGTATPVGDPIEMAAIRAVFDRSPAINSTKSQTGHMVGATGAAEIVFTSLMMEKNFISPSINLDNPEPEFGWADLVRECREGTRVKHALSNSFAFGGSNVGIVVSDCGN